MEKRSGESSRSHRGHRPSGSMFGSDRRSWKLVIDPELKKGYQKKLYRFDGCVQQSGSSYNVTFLSDPRTRTPRFRARTEPADLAIPSFKIDSNYVGVAPEREVSFFDLNDNINQAFLRDLCSKCGEIDEARIYYHPKTKRHLGLGRALFKRAKSARLCVERYNNTSVMGKTIAVILDLFGHEVKRLAEEKSNDNSPAVVLQQQPSSSSVSQGFSPNFPKVAAAAPPPPPPVNRPSKQPEPAAVSPQVPEDPMVRDLPPPPPPPPPAPPFPVPPPVPSPSANVSNAMMSWLVTPPPQPPVVWATAPPPPPAYGESSTSDRVNPHHQQLPAFAASIPLPPERPTDSEITFRKQSKRTRDSSHSSSSRSRSPSSKLRKKYYRSEHRHRDSHVRNRYEDQVSHRKRSGSSSRNRSRTHSRQQVDKYGGMEAISSDDESEPDEGRESRGSHRRYEGRKRRARRSYSSSSSRDTYSSGESRKALDRRRRDPRRSRFDRDHESHQKNREEHSPPPRSREDRSRPRSREHPPRPKSRDLPPEKQSSMAALEISEKLKSMEEPTSKEPTTPAADSSPLSLESRIQSILRGAEKEVLKAVTEEDKAKRKMPKKDSTPQKAGSIPKKTPPIAQTPVGRTPTKPPHIGKQLNAPIRPCIPSVPRPPRPHMWGRGKQPRYGTGPAWPMPRMPYPPHHQLPPHMQLPYYPQPHSIHSNHMNHSTPYIPPPKLTTPKLAPLETPIYQQDGYDLAEERQKHGKRVSQGTSKFLVRDLKTVLVKDMERRLIESSVLSSFDKWWETRQSNPEPTYQPSYQAQAYNVPYPSQANTAKPFPRNHLRHPRPSEGFMETPKSIEAEASKPISSALNELFGAPEGGLGGLPGFGLKAAIPKLPSFKRKVPEKADSDKSQSDSAMSLDSGDEGDKDEETKEEEAKVEEEEEEEKEQEKSSKQSQRISPSPAPSASTKVSEDFSTISSTDDDSSSSSDEEEPTEKESSEKTSENNNKEEKPQTESETPKEKSKEIEDDEISASSSSESDDDTDDDDDSTSIGSEDTVATPATPQTKPGAADAGASEEPKEKSLEPLVDSKAADVSEAIPVPDIEKTPDAETPAVLAEKPVEDLDNAMILDGLYIPYVYDHRYGKDPATAPLPPPPVVPEPVIEEKTPVIEVIPPKPVEKKSTKKTTPPPPRKTKIPKRAAKVFPVRTEEAEIEMLLKFYHQGMDEEDIKYLKMSYDDEDSKQLFPNWIPHPVTSANREGFMPHSTGCARAQGVYRMNEKEKRQTFMRRVTSSRDRTQLQSQRDISAARQQAQIGREARKVQRRLATSLGPDVESELLKANQLKPNCYAKIITVEGDKRIVIYSKETIKTGEEITYDYKFPLEDEKIPCLCSAPNCRGSLN